MATAAPGEQFRLLAAGPAWRGYPRRRSPLGLAGADHCQPCGLRGERLRWLLPVGSVELAQITGHALLGSSKSGVAPGGFPGAGRPPNEDGFAMRRMPPRDEACVEVLLRPGSAIPREQMRARVVDRGSIRP